MTMTRRMRPAVIRAESDGTAGERCGLIRVRAVCVKFSLLSSRFRGFRLRRTQDGELVGDLERARLEAEKGGRASARGAWRAVPAGVGEDAAAEQHALEVRGRDLVSERRDVEVAQLGDGERLGREREADVRVGELRSEA